jgi:hypothetical protein
MAHFRFGEAGGQIRSEAFPERVAFRAIDLQGLTICRAIGRAVDFDVAQQPDGTAAAVRIWPVTRVKSSA